MHRIAVPTALPVGDVNVYFVPGRVPTLVDAGPAGPGALERLAASLAFKGNDLHQVRQVAVTHTHVDHCGLAAAVHAATGSRVLAHPAAARTLVDFESTWRRRLAFHAQATTAAGAPAEVRRAFLAIYDERGAMGRSVPRSAIVALAEGDRPALGDSRWTVWHTPGHARDHVCLYQAESASLFCGDLLLRYLHTVPVLAPRSVRARDATALGQLVASWRRMGRLTVDIAWPGHGAPIRAHGILVARRLVTVRSRLRAAAEAVAEGAMTVWEVALAIGLPDSPEVLDLTLSESAALLDWLVRRGRLERRREGDLVRFRVAPTEGRASSPV